MISISTIILLWILLDIIVFPLIGQKLLLEGIQNKDLCWLLPIFLPIIIGFLIFKFFSALWN